MSIKTPLPPSPLKGELPLIGERRTLFPLKETLPQCNEHFGTLTPPSGGWGVDLEVNELRTRAKQYLPVEAQRLAQQHGFHYRQIRIKKSKTRWGSCSSKGIINLSLYLMLLPVHLIEYVLLHELCHTVVMNHSADFWSLLDRYTQGRAKALRKELRGYHIPR